MKNTIQCPQEYVQYDLHRIIVNIGEVREILSGFESGKNSVTENSKYAKLAIQYLDGASKR